MRADRLSLWIVALPRPRVVRGLRYDFGMIPMLAASLVLSLAASPVQEAPADPITLQVAQQKAMLALEQDDPADALLWLQHWRRLDPNAALDPMLARSYLGLGAGAAALEHADAVLAGEAKQDEAVRMRLVRASALEQCDRWLGAWSAYREIAASPGLEKEARDSLLALGRASLARHLERETWGQLQDWLQSLQAKDATPGPEAAVVLLSFWEWMDPSNLQAGTLELVQRHPEHPELAVTYLSHITRIPYYDISEQDRAVLETPGFAALPPLVQERYRKRVDTHAENAASAGAMWVDNYGTDGDPLEGPYLEEAAQAAHSELEVWQQQYGEALAEVLAKRTELDQTFDALDAEFNAFQELSPPPSLASMERIADELTRLREVERVLPQPLDGALDALREHVDAAQNMIWPPEDDTADVRSLLTTTARFDREQLEPLRRMRRGEGRAASLLDRWVNVWLGERPRLTAEAALARGDYATVVEATAEVLLRQEADPELWRMRREACIALEAPRLALHAAFVLAGKDAAEEPTLIELLDRYLAVGEEAALAAQAAYDQGDLEGTLPALERALHFDPVQPVALALQARIAREAQDDAALCDLTRFLWGQGIDLDLNPSAVAAAAQRLGDEALAMSALEGAVVFPDTPVRPTDVWILRASAELGRQEVSALAPGQRIEVQKAATLAWAPPGEVLRLRGPQDQPFDQGDLLLGQYAVKDKRLRLLESDGVSISSTSNRIQTADASLVSLRRCGLSALLNVADAAYLQGARARGTSDVLSFSPQAKLHLVTAAWVDGGKGPSELIAYDSHLAFSGSERLVAGSAWQVVDSVLTFLHGHSFPSGSWTLEDGSAVSLQHVELAGLRSGSLQFEGPDARIEGRAVQVYGAEDFASSPSQFQVSDLVVRPVTLPVGEPDVVTDSFESLASALRSAQPGTVIGIRMGQYTSERALEIPDGVSLVAVGGPANFEVLIKKRHAVFQVQGASALMGIRVWLKLPKNERGYLVTNLGDSPTTAIAVKEGGVLLAQNVWLDMTSILKNQFFLSLDEQARAFLCEGPLGGSIWTRQGASALCHEDFTRAFREDLGARGKGRVRLSLVAPTTKLNSNFEDSKTEFRGPCLGLQFYYGAGDAPTKARFAARMAQRPGLWASALEQFEREFAIADSLVSRKAALTRFCGQVRRADPTYGDHRFEADKYLLTHLGPKLDQHLRETGPLIGHGKFDVQVYPGKFVSKRVEAEYSAYITASVARMNDGSFSQEDEAFEEALQFFRSVQFGTQEYWLADEARRAGGGFSEMKPAIVQQRERAAEEAQQKAAALAAAELRRQQKAAQLAETARLFEQRNIERERIRRENAALLSGQSSNWYSGYSVNRNSRPQPSASWDSKYLSSDARMRDYRRKLDREIFGTRY